MQTLVSALTFSPVGQTAWRCSETLPQAVPPANKSAKAHVFATGGRGRRGTDGLDRQTDKQTDRLPLGSFAGLNEFRMSSPKGFTG